MIGLRISEKSFPLLGFWLPHIFEIFIVVVGYLAYMYTKTLVFSDFQTTAVNNSWRVIMFESDLGIFWEPVMQAWAIDSAKALVVFFNWAYIVTFWPIILISAVVLYCTNRGGAYFNLGNYQRAIDNFDRAILLDPESGSAYSNRAIAHTELGQSANADADRAKACSLDGQYC